MVLGDERGSQAVRAPVGQSRESRDRLQECSTDFDKCTEAVQGAGELIRGTRAIGHLLKITKEPGLRLHCRKTNSKGRHRGLTCKI